MRTNALQLLACDRQFATNAVQVANRGANALQLLACDRLILPKRELTRFRKLLRLRFKRSPSLARGACS
ncbi:MAG: hypothetical protein AAFY26_08305 [Cyanobacteria bacterium J06638_22]